MFQKRPRVAFDTSYNGNVTLHLVLLTAQMILCHKGNYLYTWGLRIGNIFAIKQNFICLSLAR